MRACAWTPCGAPRSASAVCWSTTTSSWIIFPPSFTCECWAVCLQCDMKMGGNIIPPLSPPKKRTGTPRLHIKKRQSSCSKHSHTLKHTHTHTHSLSLTHTHVCACKESRFALARSMFFSTRVLSATAHSQVFTVSPFNFTSASGFPDCSAIICERRNGTLRSKSAFLPLNFSFSHASQHAARPPRQTRKVPGKNLH